MKQENNAKKALSELASMVGLGTSDANRQTEPAPATADTAPVATPAAPEAPAYSAPAYGAPAYTPAPVAAVPVAAEPAPSISEAMYAKEDNVNYTSYVEPAGGPVMATATIQPSSKSVIASDMVINGSIIAKGDLDILGSHTGTIKSDGIVMVTGSVDGDIEAKALMLQNCMLIADQLTIENDVRIDNGSNVSANINCENIIINANLTGNIRASKSCRINPTAVVQGNITAASIAIGEGAIINSKIEIVSQ